MMLKMLLSIIMINSTGGGFGGFGLWVGNVNVDELNSHFKKYGIVELNSMHYGTGGQGYGVINNVFLGAGGFSMRQSVSSGEVKVDVSYGGGWFEVGYGLIMKKRIFVFPMVGIGGGGYEFKLYPESKDEPFDSILANPRRFASVNVDCYFVYPSFNMAVWLNEFVGLMIKVGYAVSLSEDWKMEEGKNVLLPPDFKPSAPLGSVSVIFGGHD